MTNQHTILTNIQDSLATIWFNRPGTRNALNKSMLEELLASLQKINSDTQIRIISLQGKGPSFCAGADLGWMQQASTLSGEENYRESILLAQCFHAIYASPKITLAGIHGAAFGGAIGLIAACDIAIATETSTLAFSEVNLGLVPATIAPYVLRKAYNGKILELMLTGRKFSGNEAAAIGLVNRSVAEENFEQAMDDLRAELLQAAPVAQTETKKMIRSLTRHIHDGFAMEQTASLLAETRVSAEAKEGIRAFFEKRLPGWINT
jgi:methylglutaconyl-CoA hydratase